MNTEIKAWIVAAVGLAALVAGCAAPASAPAAADPTTTRDGPAVPFGQGTVHTYVVSDAAGHPTEVGVRMSRAALDGLPAAATDPRDTAVLALPAGSGTVVDHVVLNWNPHGHPPLALFGKPHFDVHFYLADAASVAAIKPGAPDYAAQAATLPAAKYVPHGYVPPPGSPADNAVPGMGLHWTDTADQTIPGRYDFQQIFINGTWNGRYTFMEPMITRDFMLAHGTVSKPVEQPDAYQSSGYFPTGYRIRTDDATGDEVVALDGLTARQQS